MLGAPGAKRARREAEQVADLEATSAVATKIVDEAGDVAAQGLFAAPLRKLEPRTAAAFVGQHDPGSAEVAQTLHMLFFLPRVLRTSSGGGIGERFGRGSCDRLGRWLGAFFSTPSGGGGSDVDEVGVVGAAVGPTCGKMSAISSRTRAVRSSESFAASSSRSRRFSSSAGLDVCARRPGARGSIAVTAHSTIMLTELVESLFADVQSFARVAHSAIAGDRFQDHLDPLFGEIRSWHTIDVLRPSRGSSTHRIPPRSRHDRGLAGIGEGHVAAGGRDCGRQTLGDDGDIGGAA
jgi:hypothetical protein